MSAAGILRRLASAVATAALLFWLPAADRALADDLQPSFNPTINDWGEYGLIQAPTARTGEDGDFHFYASEVPPYTRFGFEVTALPWLEAGFRYTSVGNRLYGPTSFSGNQSYKDRSFSVKVRLIKEGSWWPETSIGIRDIAGTGLFSGEYLVFSRRVYDVDLTAGLGWGYLSSDVSLPNPLGLISSFFKTRPPATAAGGFTFDFFRGPNVGLFGGVEYHTHFHGVKLKLELDPNDYQTEPLGNVFTVKSPVNAAIEYQPFSFLDISAGFERGTTVMFRASLHTNFNHPGIPIFDSPPPKTLVRKSSEPPGKPIDEAYVPLVVGQTEPPDDKLIFEDVPAPSVARAGGDLSRFASASEPPRGVPFAKTNLPRASAGAAPDEAAGLFDEADRLGVVIDAVDIHGDTVTLTVSAPHRLVDGERAALEREALLGLPAIRHVVIHASVSNRRIADAGGINPHDRTLEDTSLPTLAANPETADVDRLYDGARALGYRIENVAMNGDVATISVEPEQRSTRSGQDRLIRLALASLPGTSRAEVVDLKRHPGGFGHELQMAQADGNEGSPAKGADKRSAAFGQDIFTELKAIGFRGLSFAIEDHRATLFFSQAKYRQNAEAIGRAARIVLRHIPPDVEAVTIDLVQSGMTLVSVNLQRADLERAVENAGSPEEIWANTTLAAGDMEPLRGFKNADAYPTFTWSLTPQLEQQLGGPNNFYIYEVYAALEGETELRRGWTLDGTLGAGLFGNLSELKLESNSTLPHVRSDIKDYLKDGKYGIYDLQTDYMFDIAQNWYGRVSAGLLERMFGGVDAEVLYRPYGERWAVGLDVNHVWQRGFHELFGFQSYNVTTAHLSLYYKLPFFHLTAKLSAGQYLAGDRGATLELSRKFDNGIVAGIFATKTNVSASQFGEGSFDKGFFITIPLDLFFGRPTQSAATYVYRPLTRDGGQMLDIKKPLYEATDGADPDTLSEQWPHLLD